MPTNPPSPQDEQAGAAAQEAARALLEHGSLEIGEGLYADAAAIKRAAKTLLPILTRLQQAARDEGLEMAAKVVEGMIGASRREIAAAIRALSRAGKERG